MKITVLNLDTSRLFLKTFRITHRDQVEKLRGYYGNDLFVRAEREPNDSAQLVDAVDQILFRYNTDFKDAAVFLFKAICRSVNGKFKEDSNGETWTICS